MQRERLLRTACWDAGQVRDEVRSLVIERRGHPQGCSSNDEAGFLKKGTHSAGVQRQYTGTAGRVENAQVGVFGVLHFAARSGVDRPPALPAPTVLVRRQAALRRGRSARAGRFRDQAGAGHPHDHRGAGCRHSGVLWAQPACRSLTLDDAIEPPSPFKLRVEFLQALYCLPDELPCTLLTVVLMAAANGDLEPEITLCNDVFVVVLADVTLECLVY